MAIKRITRAEFDRFEPQRAAEAEEVFEEVEWFRDEGRTVIAVLARHRADDDWAYAVLGRDEHGTFRAFESEVGFPGPDETRTELLGLMEHIVAAGISVFPQGD